jgi:hypothetical protein
MGMKFERTLENGRSSSAHYVSTREGFLEREKTLGPGDTCEAGTR